MTNSQIQTNWSGRDLFKVLLLILIFFAVAGLSLGQLENPRQIFSSNNANFTFYWALQWVVLFLPVLIISLIKGGSKKTFLLRKVAPKKLLTSTALGFFAVVLLSMALSAIFFSLGNQANAQDVAVLKSLELSGWGLVWMATIICVAGPIIEELFFRGFILTSAIGKVGYKQGSLVTALLFGLMHFSLMKFIFLVPFGLILNHLAYKNRSILPAIIVHILNNTLAFIITVTMF